MRQFAYYKGQKTMLGLGDRFVFAHEDVTEPGQEIGMVLRVERHGTFLTPKSGEIGEISFRTTQPEACATENCAGISFLKGVRLRKIANVDEPNTIIFVIE